MTVSETIQKSRELQAQVAAARDELRGTRMMVAGTIRKTTKRYLCEECQAKEGSSEPWHYLICECYDPNGEVITERSMTSICDGCRQTKPVAVFGPATTCPECGSIIDAAGRCVSNCTKVGC